MKVKYTGRKYAILAGAAISTGEIREVSQEQLDEAEKYHPGAFERVGAPAIQPEPELATQPEPEAAIQPEPEPAADTQAESEPVNDAIPDAEIPKVEVSDVNPPVDSGRPPAGGRSTPRRRAKR